MNTKSISGRNIRLTDERWRHIVEGHPEMAGHLHDVLITIAEPDFVFKGNTGELLAAVYQRADKMLVVMYKEATEDGFIITAFFTKRIEKILKRTIVWQKS